MNKKNLPTKICKVCKKDFSWRKKWKSCWDQVLYCSERCRRNKKFNGNNYGKILDLHKKGDLISGLIKPKYLN